MSIYYVFHIFQSQLFFKNKQYKPGKHTVRRHISGNTIAIQLPKTDLCFSVKVQRQIQTGNLYTMMIMGLATY